MILKSLKGKQIVVTGEVLGYSRRELVAPVKRLGGHLNPDADVSRATDVLVRGISAQWMYRTYGKKEARAAQLVKEGFPIVMIYEDAFRKLLRGARGVRTADSIAGHRVESLVRPGALEDFLRAAAISGPTDGLAEGVRRREQAYLRRQLFARRRSQRCDLCGRDFPVDFLVAAHIKPRSQCSPSERKDAANIVFAACRFGCDELYERGLVAVADGGKIVTIPRQEAHGAVREALRALKGRSCVRWAEGNSGYFGWHRERRFLGR